MFQYFEWNYPNDGSLWRHIAERAVEIKNLGTTAVWMPPAYKGMSGIDDVGYGVYDLYDLGEFDQKGTVRTKYGTREEFIAAVKAIKDAGMHVYADTVLNHRMGGDATEKAEVEDIACDNRNNVISEKYTTDVWSAFNFEGRNGKYSQLKLRKEHFNAFGADGGKIQRLVGKNFSGEVCFEHGNFDYLMGADVDHYNQQVKDDLLNWGKWVIEASDFDGFRLDAVKHIPASFFKDWLHQIREHFKGRDVFAVGEYWTGSLDELRGYQAATEGAMTLFDVPLHYKLHEASKSGNSFDMARIFDGTLVQDNPVNAVTFVDNHDSQPGQSLESWIDDWFKPIAYALILLRKDGYPCVFYGDYFGNNTENMKLTSHRKIIDDFLQVRAKYTHGEQHDYFDHSNCIGWVWTGDEEHPYSAAVVLSNGDTGTKHMKTPHAKATYRDVTGHWPEPVTTDENGEAEFKCLAGSVSVWVQV